MASSESGVTGTVMIGVTENGGIPTRARLLLKRANTCRLNPGPDSVFKLSLVNFIPRACQA